jgi:hypothetical protein
MPLFLQKKIKIKIKEHAYYISESIVRISNIIQKNSTREYNEQTKNFHFQQDFFLYRA